MRSSPIHNYSSFHGNRVLPTTRWTLQNFRLRRVQLKSAAPHPRRNFVDTSSQLIAEWIRHFQKSETIDQMRQVCCIEEEKNRTDCRDMKQTTAELESRYPQMISESEWAVCCGQPYQLLQRGPTLDLRGHHYPTLLSKMSVRNNSNPRVGFPNLPLVWLPW